MREIAIIVNLLCGLVVLASGIIYLRNTLKLNHTHLSKETTVRNLLKEFDSDFFKFLLVTFLSAVIPIFIKGNDLGAIIDVFFPAIVVTAAIEGAYYISKYWFDNQRRYATYFKLFLLVLFGMINGLSI